jgi:hypothetical protein
VHSRECKGIHSTTIDAREHLDIYHRNLQATERESLRDK